MKKKIYMKPAIEVCMAEAEQELLAGSLTEVSTDLGAGDELILPSDDDITGILWDEAM